MSAEITAQDIAATHADVPFTMVTAYRLIEGRTIAVAARIYDCGHVIGTPPCVEAPEGGLTVLPEAEAKHPQIEALARDLTGMARGLVASRKISGFIAEHIDEIADMAIAAEAKLRGLN